MVPTGHVGATLEERIHNILHVKGRPASASALADVVQLAAAERPTLRLPPAAPPISRSFLPHNLPLQPPSQPGCVVSWESPAIRSLGVPTQAAARVIVGGAGHLVPSDSLGGIAVPAAPAPPKYEGGGAVPRGLRPASGNTLLASSAAPMRHQRSSSPPPLPPPPPPSKLPPRRLLPGDMQVHEISSSLPNLAYSTYRALDVWRGAPPAAPKVSRKPAHHSNHSPSKLLQSRAPQHELPVSSNPSLQMLSVSSSTGMLVPPGTFAASPSGGALEDRTWRPKIGGTVSPAPPGTPPPTASTSANVPRGRSPPGTGKASSRPTSRGVVHVANPVQEEMAKKSTDLLEMALNPTAMLPEQASARESGVERAADDAPGQAATASSSSDAAAQPAAQVLELDPAAGDADEDEMRELAAKLLQAAARNRLEVVHEQEKSKRKMLRGRMFDDQSSQPASDSPSFSYGAHDSARARRLEIENRTRKTMKQSAAIEQGGFSLDQMLSDSEESSSGGSDESDDDIDWSTMSALAHEARGAVKRLGSSALSRRRAFLQPRFESKTPTGDAKGRLRSFAKHAASGNRASRAPRLGKMPTLELAEISRAFIRSRQIVGALRSAQEFANLSDAQIAMLAQGGQERRVPRYSIVFREGSAAHSFYVLLRGRVQHSNFHSAHTYEMFAPRLDRDEGVCLGTEGLSGNLKRVTTVTTLDECTVLHFSTHGLSIDQNGLAQLAARASKQVVIAAMKQNTFFQHASERTLEELAPLFRLEEITRGGERIIEEGGPSDKIFLLLDGSVTVSVSGTRLGILPDPDGSERKPVFGEGAIVSTAASMSTVVSREPCKLLVLSRPKFHRLNTLMPDLKEQIKQLIRLRTNLMKGKIEERDFLPSAEEAASRIQRIARKRLGGVRRIIMAAARKEVEAAANA